MAERVSDAGLGLLGRAPGYRRPFLAALASRIGTWLACVARAVWAGTAALGALGATVAVALLRPAAAVRADPVREHA